MERFMVIAPSHTCGAFRDGILPFFAKGFKDFKTNPARTTTVKKLVHENLKSSSFYNQFFFYVQNNCIINSQQITKEI